MLAVATAVLTCATLVASTSAPASTTTSSTIASNDATPSAKAAPASEAPHLDMGDARTQALLVLTGGVVASVASSAAFVTGFDAERELRASTHDEADADALLNKRTVAAWIAWPTAILGVVGVTTGVALLASANEPDSDAHAPRGSP